ncbi:MAG TPA: hypothetical protein EYQ86_03340 [Bacteroidetes bacterium]|nr:hypothetical protein [Bacteroidota bacterium]HIL26224.1 hypothetical protein [Nitrospinaceae bacterium]
MAFGSVVQGQDDLDDLLGVGGEAVSETVTATFKTTRIINSHSTEMVKAKHLDFRIAHRFGDMFGASGGAQTMFGIDNASDIRIGFEYGLNENFSLGFGRSKGGNTIKSIIEAYAKYKIIQQTKDNKKKISIVLISHMTASYMSATEDATLITSFENFAHRLTYVSQILIAKKFTNSFSLQVMPSYVHRNLVSYDDENGLFAMGVGGRLKLTKRFGVIADYFHCFRSQNTIGGLQHYNPLSFGIEIETGGHVFHINFTNSRSISEGQFISNTSSDLMGGQFRFGFNISRLFVL